MGRTTIGAAVTLLVGVLLLGSPASAHDDIAGSDPASGSTIDEPISAVTIDFGEEVADVEMALLDPDDEVLPSTTVQVSPTVVRIEFDELDEQGIYITRYLAPVTADGHTLAGAIQFTYGSAGGSSNTTTILLFCAFAIVVLSTGAWFSWRRYKALSSAEPDELADTPA